MEELVSKFETLEKLIKANFPQIISGRLGEEKAFFEIVTLVEGEAKSLQLYYDTVTSGGTKEKGMSSDFFATEEMARDEYEKQFISYLREKIDPAKCYEIVWRMLPKLNTNSYRLGLEREDGRIILGAEKLAHSIFSRLILREVVR